ncbi:MAG: hypothetical protein WC273_05695 [Dehalococcoidia bacterium]
MLKDPHLERMLAEYRRRVGRAKDTDRVPQADDVAPEKQGAAPAR